MQADPRKRRNPDCDAAGAASLKFVQNLIANPAPLEQQLDLELLLGCGGDEVSDVYSSP